MKLFDLGDGGNFGRSGKERRQGSGGYEGKERRSGVDRRGLKFGLRFRTSWALAPLEDWLSETFPGQHQFQIEEISEDFTYKDVKVLFATDEQRNRFKAILTTYLKLGEL